MSDFDPFAGGDKDDRVKVPMKFPEIGAEVDGVVEDFFNVQDRDFDTEELLWLDKEQTKPKNVLVIVLQTNLRGTYKYQNRKWVHVPEVEGDTGLRTLFAKGQLWSAIRDGVRESGDKFQIGSRLKVTYTADGTPKNEKHNPPKIHKAVHKGPVEEDPFSV